jgi:ribonucleoside-diphosphate reductase alpha chain
VVQHRPALGLRHRRPGQGHFYVDEATGEVTRLDLAYERPQPHACFIQSVGDDLVNEGGIMDLWVREARLFKYGSGTGTNFSNLRGEGEPLSGGGKSSGLMSFLKIGDRAAGAIKSGGTTRRAAKMVIVDARPPGHRGQFIDWKVKSRSRRWRRWSPAPSSPPPQRHHRACHDFRADGSERPTPSTPRRTTRPEAAMKAARAAMVPENYVVSA